MPTSRHDELIALVELAYAAIDDGSLWHGVACRFAGLLDSDYSQIVIEDCGGALPLFAVSSHSLVLEEYLGRYRAIDPFTDGDLVAGMTHARRAFLSQELVEDRALRSSDFYTEFLRLRGNLFWGCGGNYMLGTHTLVQIWTWRDKAHGAFEEAERSLADNVVRQILRAVQLQRRLTALQRQSLQNEAVQDRLTDAVLVLDQRDRVIQRNARAASLLNGIGNEPHFTPRLLKLTSSAEQHRLSDAMQQARAAPRGDPICLRLLRPPPLPPLYAVVAAATQTSAPGTIQLFLRDPRWQHFLPETDLVALFQLTSAQARVCAALVHGESLEDISQRLSIRLATVRSHIKDAMEKIGLHRQSDLVRHLSLALPALVQPDARA